MDVIDEANRDKIINMLIVINTKNIKQYL